MMKETLASLALGILFTVGASGVASRHFDTEVPGDLPE